MKMKCDELQVKLREKDIHVKHLKDQLNESEKKILQLQKVYTHVLLVNNMYVRVYIMQWHEIICN